jgi:hypothetical protein
MISSDLHGDEEPVRWLLGWQRQDRVVESPCTKKKKDTLIRTSLAELQCITELKEIKQKVTEPVWEFD